MNTRNAPFAPSSVLDVEARGKPIDVLIASARVVASESSDARVGRHSSRCRTIGKRESRRADLLVYRRRPFITNPTSGSDSGSMPRLNAGTCGRSTAAAIVGIWPTSPWRNKGGHGISAIDSRLKRRNGARHFTGGLGKVRG